VVVIWCGRIEEGGRNAVVLVAMVAVIKNRSVGKLRVVIIILLSWQHKQL